MLNENKIANTIKFCLLKPAFRVVLILFYLLFMSSAVFAQTLKINNGAIATTSRSVNLSIDVPTNAYEMFISGDVTPDKNSFQWVLHTEKVTIKLTEPDGKKSIQIRFRDVARREFGDAKATILLERSAPVITGIKLADGSGFINPAENVDLRIRVQVEVSERSAVRRKSSGFIGKPYQMHISGDIKNDIRTFDWVSYTGEAWVTLLKNKDSDKREVTVKLRGLSGLESSPVTAVIRLLQPKEGENPPQNDTLKTGEEPKDEPPAPLSIEEERKDNLPKALSLLINGGEKVTSSRIVSLSLEAENAAEMYISGDVTNVRKDIVFRWKPYVPQIDVYLSAGDGTKIITVKFRNRDKHVSETLQSQILLDRSPPSKITSISTVSSNSPSGDDGIYHAGELIEIKVYQAQYKPSLTGALTITSHLSGYYSGMIPVKAGADSFIAAWDTTGLKEAADYTIIAHLRDNIGREVTSAPQNVTIDNTPPRVKNIILKDDKGNPLGKATSNRNISIQSDVLDADSMLVEGDVTGQSWVKYTSNLPAQLTEGDGTKSIIVKFKDKADNETQVKQTVILAQNGPKILKLDSYIEANPLDNDEVYQPGGNIRIEVQAQSELEIQGTIRIKSAGYDSDESADGFESAVFFQELAFSGDSLSFLWNTAQLTDANYTAHITLTDSVGNQSSGDLIITLDSTPPSQPTLIINGGVPSTASQIIGLKLSNEDATEVFVSGDIVRDDKTFNWTPFDTSSIFPVTLLSSAGLKQISVKYRDAAGNIGPSITGSIEYNPAKPIPTTLAINGGQTHTNTKEVTLTLIADGAAEMYISGDIIDGGKWIPFSTPIKATLNDGDGRKTLIAQFRNARAQVIEKATAQITLDTTPPQIIAVSAADSLDRQVKSQFAIGTPVLIRVTTEEANLAGTARVISPLKHYDSGSLTLQGDSNYGLEVLWNTMRLTPAADYVVHVELEDTLSNTTLNDSLTLTLIPPVVEHRILINDGATFTDNPSVYLTLFSANASEMYLEGDIEGENIGEWIPYEPKIQTSLSAGDGIKRIRVKYKHSVETGEAEATITLAAKNPVIKKIETRCVGVEPQRQQNSSPQQTFRAGEMVLLSAQSEGSYLQGVLQIKSIATGYNSGWMKLDKRSETQNSVTFSYIWNTTGLTEARDYTASVKITDALKRTALSSLTLTIDNSPSPPKIQSVSVSDAIDPSDSDGNYHSGQQLMVTIKTEDTTSELRAHVELTSAQHQLTYEPELTKISSNQKNANIEFSHRLTLDTRDMPEGDYSLKITVFDQRNRQASDTSQHIVIDNTPPSLISLIANNGAEITSKRTIPLKIRASDATQMRISLEGEESTDTWIPYKENLSITLSGGDGYKEIRLFLRDAAKNEISAKTSVTLDVERPTVQKTALLISSRSEHKGKSLRPYLLVLSFSEPIKRVNSDRFHLKLIESADGFRSAVSFQTSSQTLLELVDAAQCGRAKGVCSPASSITVEDGKLLIEWFGGLNAATLPIEVVIGENSAQDFSGKGNLSNQAQPALLTYTELNLLEQMQIMIDDEPVSSDSYIFISPNGDGKRDALNLFYTLNSNANMLLRIQNDKGETVEQSVHQERQAGYEYSLKWPKIPEFAGEKARDSAVNEEENIAEGVYSLDLIAQTDLFAFPITLVRLQVSVDNTPPDITLNPESKKTRHISKSSNIEITISEQGNPPGYIARAYAILDATQTIPIYQEPMSQKSTNLTFQLSTDKLQPGSRKFVFYAEDEAGNVSQKEASYEMLQEDEIILEMSNHPNPFANDTILFYSLANQIDQCFLSIYDIRGTLVYSTNLNGDYLEKGEHRFPYNARNSQGERLAKGLYFWVIQVQAAERHERKTHRIAVK